MRPTTVAHALTLAKQKLEAHSIVEAAVLLISWQQQLD
jgi:hypothetical protein